jgi:hypothetical protein
MNKTEQPKPRPKDAARQDIRQQNPGGDRNRVSDKAADEPARSKPKKSGK